MTIYWTPIDDAQPGTDRPVIAWGRVHGADGREVSPRQGEYLGRTQYSLGSGFKVEKKLPGGGHAVTVTHWSDITEPMR
jgi:transcriptional regulator CtsR